MNHLVVSQDAFIRLVLSEKPAYIAGRHMHSKLAAPRTIGPPTIKPSTDRVHGFGVTARAVGPSTIRPAMDLRPSILVSGHDISKKRSHGWVGLRFYLVRG